MIWIIFESTNFWKLETRTSLESNYNKDTPLQFSFFRILCYHFFNYLRHTENVTKKHKKNGRKRNQKKQTLEGPTSHKWTTTQWPPPPRPSPLPRPSLIHTHICNDMITTTHQKKKNSQRTLSDNGEFNVSNSPLYRPTLVRNDFNLLSPTGLIPLKWSSICFFNTFIELVICLLRFSRSFIIFSFCCACLGVCVFGWFFWDVVVLSLLFCSCCYRCCRYRLEHGNMKKGGEVGSQTRRGD